MRKISRFGVFRQLVLFFVLVILAGCATEKVVAPDLVWPLPPDSPRIKYVGQLRTSLDVEESSSMSDAIFGTGNEFQLVKPYGVAVDTQGRVYVSEVGKIVVFDRKNKKVRFIGDTGMGKLAQPAGIAVSARDGRVFVTDISEDKVFVYDRNFSFLTTIGAKGDMDNPINIALDDSRQRLYIADSKKNQVIVYSTVDGKLLFTIGKKGEVPGEFNTLSHLALDKEGKIYVADTQNFRVQIFSPEGKSLKTFGQVGDSPGSFSRPKGIALDSEGHIYVVDAMFHNVQIFDREGQLLLFFGSHGVNPGEFFLPAGIAIGDDDMIYVTEQFTARVQVFQYLGEKSKHSPGGEGLKK